MMMRLAFALLASVASLLVHSSSAQSIVDVVVGTEDFGILEAAVVQAGLAETLSGAGPFT